MKTKSAQPPAIERRAWFADVLREVSRARAKFPTRCSPATRLAVEWLCDTITEQIAKGGIVGPHTSNARTLRRVEAIRGKYGLRRKPENAEPIDRPS